MADDPVFADRGPNACSARDALRGILPRDSRTGSSGMSDTAGLSTHNGRLPVLCRIVEEASSRRDRPHRPVVASIEHSKALQHRHIPDRTGEAMTVPLHRRLRWRRRRGSWVWSPDQSRWH